MSATIDPKAEVGADQIETKTAILSKLTVKDLGNPRVVDDEHPRIILGTIIGIATGTKVKVDSKGEAFEAIVGQFEGTSADGKKVVSAAMLYLPGGFHETITQQFAGENPPKRIDFAFEVAAVVAKNPIGYSYAFRPLIEAAPSEPMAALRKMVEERKALLLGSDAKTVKPQPKTKEA